MLEEQSISKVLILDLNPLIIDILDCGTPKNSPRTLTSSLFEAPLCGIAATLTVKTLESKLTTCDLADLGLTEAKIFTAKKYWQAHTET